MPINCIKRPKSTSPRGFQDVSGFGKFYFLKFGLLDFDPCYKNHALIFLGHPLGFKDPGHEFSISNSNINCAKI